MATTSSVLSTSLRDFANQLEQICTSISEMAKDAPEYKEIISRVALNVQSTSTVVRSASTVIKTMELHKEHLALSKAARAAKAGGSGR